MAFSHQTQAIVLTIATILPIAGITAQPAAQDSVGSSEAADAAPPESEWLVRHVSGLPVDFHREFALRGEPNWHEIEDPQSSLRSVVIQRCGDQRDEVQKILVDLAMEYNSIDDPDFYLAKGDIIAVPFCLPVFKDQAVEVTEYQNFELVLEEYIGFSGKITQSSVYRENNKGQYARLEDFKASIEPGDSIVLPVSAPSVAFVPRVASSAGAKNDPSSIAAELEPMYSISLAKSLFLPPELTRQLPDPPRRASPQLGEVKLVSSVALKDEEYEAACGGAATDSFSLPPSSRLKRVYENTRVRLGGGPTKAAVVGIIDTGLHRYKDDFFRGQLFYINKAERSGVSGQNDDRDGSASQFVDDVVGASIDFTGSIRPLLPLSARDRSHGTQMASLVLGSQDIGINWLGNMEEPPIKLRIFNFAEMRGSTAKMASADRLQTAVRYLADTGANIINLSLATQFQVSSLESTFREHPDILFVIAAGNGVPGGTRDGVDVTINNIRPALFGGMTGYQNVVTVGAHGFDGTRASFSNHSSESVDFFAPGCGLLARDESGRFGTISGTSGSAALTAFTAALVRSLGIEDPKEVRNRLRMSADFDERLDGLSVIPGRLNIEKAISVGDDIVQLNDASQSVLIGEVVRPSAFFANCKSKQEADQLFRTIDDRSIRKVVPNVPTSGGALELHFWLDLHRPVRRKCLQIGADERPHYRMSNLNTKNGPVAMPTIDKIRDVVFRHEN